MLKVTEFFDIEKIEKMRKKHLNKGLDEFDNFSYHLALMDENKLYGTARFYKKEDNLILDNIALIGGAENGYYELLFKALLLKASSIDCKYIKVIADKEKEFYFRFNFDEELKVKPDKIIFPKECK